MSGECNVCGQYHAEIRHCAFRELFDDLQAENEALKKRAEAAERDWQISETVNELLKKALADCVYEQNNGEHKDRQCAANRARDLLESLKGGE